MPFCIDNKFDEGWTERLDKALTILLAEDSESLTGMLAQGVPTGIYKWIEGYNSASC
jgi:hypothetical protein